MFSGLPITSKNWVCLKSALGVMVLSAVARMTEQKSSEMTSDLFLIFECPIYIPFNKDHLIRFADDIGDIVLISPNYNGV
jgi:hypothetical protein